MTPGELRTFLDLTAAITYHQDALEAAVKAKQELARKLYQRYGRHAVYRIGDGDEQLDLMVARTKAGTYYFAPRVRYTKESRLAKAEKRRLDRAARMQSYPTQASIPRPTPVTAAEISQADLDAAMKRGSTNPSSPEEKRRLPIVGDVEQPPAPVESRLLDIREPSGVLIGDGDPEQ